jgi:hypothetical protein
MPPFATRYRTETIEGHELFFREAGDPSRPAVVLLHGFPASSFMFRELIAALADRYHVPRPTTWVSGARQARLSTRSITRSTGSPRSRSRCSTRSE